MAKYINKAVRVIVVNGKALIPGAEAIELAAEDVVLLKKEIDNGDIAEAPEEVNETVYETAVEKPTKKSGK